MNIPITGAAGVVGRNLAAPDVGKLCLYDVDSPVSVLEEGCPDTPITSSI